MHFSWCRVSFGDEKGPVSLPPHKELALELFQLPLHAVNPD
jgi:hypothetical protein